MLAWRPSDPGHFALRLAIRTGVVVPISLALGQWTGNDDTALFAAFGAFAMLLFVDFGGPGPARLLAYGLLAVTGSALIAIGTLCSPHPAVAALVMLVVGFTILFAGVANGYAAAASLAALLSYVLAAMVPGHAADIGARLAGWWIAAALSVPASLLLLPARPNDRLRATVAAACRALAAYLRERTADTAHAMDAAAAAMRDRLAMTPYRPSGPTRATGAVAAMVDEVDWLRAMALRPSAAHAALAPTPGELALRALSADALDASAALVARRSTLPPDRAALERARARVFDELVGQLDDPALRADGELLWAALRRAWDARAISYLTLELADRAQEAGGLPTDRDGPAWRSVLRRQWAALGASGRVAAAHAGSRSIWFRNSVRGALGLAIAVLLAGELSVQHAFWVVLGSLSVLRSSALNTGATIAQALLGTVVGIVVGGVLVLGIGDDRTVLWVVLPFAAMLAAYAPRAVSFAAGQAGFTVAVLVIFNLIATGGWQVGLVRLEDVSIGFAISLGVGLLLWPLGAAALLRRSLADALDAGARYAEAVSQRLATGAAPDEAAHAAIEMAASQERLHAAFRQRLAERATRDLQMAPLARLMSATARLRGSGDAMSALADNLGATPRPDEAQAIVAAAADVAGWYETLGQRVAEREAPPAIAPIGAALDPELAAGLREAYRTGSRDRLVAAAALVWGGQHLQQLADLGERFRQAAVELSVAAGRRPDPPSLGGS